MEIHRAKFVGNWNNCLDGQFVPDLRPYDARKHEIDQVFNITCFQNNKITHHFKSRIVYLQRIRLVELSPGVSYITFGLSPELTRKKLIKLYIGKIDNVDNVNWVYIIHQKLHELIY